MVSCGSANARRDRALTSLRLSWFSQNIRLGHSTGVRTEVQRAIADEPGEGGERETQRDIRLVTEHGMFEIVPESEVRGKMVRTAWLDDFGRVGVRGRLVAKEFNTLQARRSQWPACWSAKRPDKGSAR